jgi:hypothetical protein
MRVALPLLVATLAGTAVTFARAAPTSITNIRRSNGKVQTQDQATVLPEVLADDLALHNEDSEKSFLSLSQDDPDPAGRARRFSYRAPFWEFTSYDSYDPELVYLTTAAFAGILGRAALGEQSATIAGQLDVSVATSLRVLVPPLYGTCLTISKTCECLEHLDSYLPLYSALPPEYQPAAFKFYDSDYAFFFFLS